MKKLILAFTLFFLILPLTAKEKVVFESVLKDADFRPLYAFKVDTYEETIPCMGWWTLKFENGAVITVNRARLSTPKDEIWWIGKEYKVIKKGNYLRAKLIEEEKEKKEKPKTDF